MSEKNCSAPNVVVVRYSMSLKGLAHVC